MGTIHYWIHELSFKFAFNGDTLGRQLNQARILMPKVPESERKILETHVDLTVHAVRLGTRKLDNYSDSEVEADWGPLRRAGAVLTITLKFRMHERYTTQS